MRRPWVPAPGLGGATGRLPWASLRLGGGSLPSSWPCGLESVTGCDFVSFVNHGINKNSFLRVIAQTFLGPALQLVRS